MYELSVDFKKCLGCMKCEVMLPGFRTIHGGRLLISETNAQDEEIRAVANRVEECCSEGAIIFRVIVC
jgi:hypothetical protein